MIFAPAAAWNREGGVTTHKSSQISAATENSGIFKARKMRFVPNGTSSPKREIRSTPSGAAVKLRFS